MNKIVTYLMKFHLKENSILYKIVSLFCGVVFFLGILPALFIWTGIVVGNHIPFELNRTVEYVLSAISVVFGLFMLVLTTFFQWKMGKGTPAPNAPTQHLVVSGTYRIL